MHRNNYPSHILVIPDGNRRWAKNYGSFPSDGYAEGAKRFREVSRAAFEMGIPRFTFWGASYDNLKQRKPGEVQAIFLLLRQELANKKTLPGLVEERIKMRVLGDWFSISHDTQLLEVINNLESRTEKFTDHFLTILFGFNFSETIRPSRLILPHADLIIRTGSCEEGSYWTHNSCGVMSFLAEDGRIFSPPTLWPAFTADRFREAIEDYAKVPRRHGA